LQRAACQGSSWEEGSSHLPVPAIPLTVPALSRTWRHHVLEKARAGLPDPIAKQGGALILCPCHAGRRLMLPGPDSLGCACRTPGHGLRVTLQAGENEPLAPGGKSVRRAVSEEQKTPHGLPFCTRHTGARGREDQ
jgi:hypothetical protein